MAKKYGIYCENCNTLLNNEDNICGSNFGHLYHSTCMGSINHGKSTDCQPQMLFKMNLKFGDTPTLTTTETEREIMELKNSNNAARQPVQQLKAKIKTLEDDLLVQDRLKDDVNKLMDCAVKLENTLSINVLDKSTDIVNNTSQDKSNKQAYDENNLNSDDSPLTGEAEEQNNSNSGMLQPVQQLEARIKTLEDALLQAKSDGNKLTEGVETVENNKAADNATDGGNNVTEDPKASKETNNESDLSAEQNNDTEKVASASASEDHHTCTISEEKQEVLDLRWNCVLIQNPKCKTANLDEAFSYVRELAKKMNARIADNSVIHIDMDSSNWYVYFRDAESKFKFLRNRFIFEHSPTGLLLRILDYTDCGIVNICNFKSSDLSSDTAFVNVLGLAKKMGMTNISSFIDHIDVLTTGRNYCKYSVRFNSEAMKNAFLQNKGILNKFPETEFVTISDEGGHASSKYNVNDFSMAAASANVIGVAGLMGLSLSADNFKRIYVLNVKKFSYYKEDPHISLVVEFSSNDIKNKFLKKTSELERIRRLFSYTSYEEIQTYKIMNISDIEKEGGNTVFIKYYKDSDFIFAAASFIGLAKQLGFSFTPDQIDRLIESAQFISNVSS